MMTDDGPDPFTNLFEAPAKFARALFAPMAEAAGGNPLSAEDMRHWAEVGTKLQTMWLEYQAEQLADPRA
ncbi:MAG TPA: class I poly(R)-hydroxyalkanoic acid synthase, partial [Erythrobacter sp.]|nr:class I poly(R)-hydroxyalkanoic acid synthase [Erythrobacter sp.]